MFSEKSKLHYDITACQHLSTLLKTHPARLYITHGFRDAVTIWKQMRNIHNGWMIVSPLSPTGEKEGARLHGGVKGTPLGLCLMLPFTDKYLRQRCQF